MKKAVLSNPKQGLFDAIPVTRLNQRLAGCFEGITHINGRSLQMKLWLGTTDAT